MRMPFDQGLNEFHEAPLAGGATQVPGSQLLCLNSTARTKPLPADRMRLSRIGEYQLARLTRFQGVAFAQPFLQFPNQWNPGRERTPDGHPGTDSTGHRTWGNAGSSQQAKIVSTVLGSSTGRFIALDSPDEIDPMLSCFPIAPWLGPRSVEPDLDTPACQGSTPG